MSQILVIDDEVGIRELLSEILGDEGHTVLLAESAQQARSVRVAQPIDLVLLDIWMPDTDGVTLLREWAYGLAHPSSNARNADRTRWPDWFNRSRPHSALNGRSPASRVNDLLRNLT